MTKVAPTKKRFDVTAFGEGGLRLSVPEGERIEAALRFDVDVAGSEVNVVGALAHLGRRCGWVSSLPKSSPGRRVLRTLNQSGVNVEGIVWRESGRVSVYYVEYAGAPRATSVLYDRKESSFANLTPADIDWSYLLDTRHIHVSGVTVPLSAGVGKIIDQAFSQARAQGVSTSLDVNYRQQLWSPSEARDRLLPLLGLTDLAFCSRRDVAELFGCSGEPLTMARQFIERTNCQRLVMSLGAEGVIGCDANMSLTRPAQPVKIVDRIGAGDALAAGVLHGWLDGDFAKGLEFGAALSALAMSQRGDMVITDPSELERLISGPGALDIER